MNIYMGVNAVHMLILDVHYIVHSLKKTDTLNRRNSIPRQMFKSSHDKQVYSTSLVYP
jgi:hypothetical protein